MNIELTDELKSEHPFAYDIIKILKETNEEDLLEALDYYVSDILSYSADLLNKEILLGEVALYPPNEWDDWTDDEKLALFDRWDVINRLVALSRVGIIFGNSDGDEGSNSSGGLVN